MGWCVLWLGLFSGFTGQLLCQQHSGFQIHLGKQQLCFQILDSLAFLSFILPLPTIRPYPNLPAYPVCLVFLYKCIIGSHLEVSWLLVTRRYGTAPQSFLLRPWGGGQPKALPLPHPFPPADSIVCRQLYWALPHPPLSCCLSNEIEKVGFPGIQGYTVFRQLLHTISTYGSTVGSMGGGFNCIQVYAGGMSNQGLITRFPFYLYDYNTGSKQEHWVPFAMCKVTSLDSMETAFFLPRSKGSGLLRRGRGRGAGRKGR